MQLQRSRNEEAETFSSPMNKYSHESIIVCHKLASNVCLHVGNGGSETFLSGLISIKKFSSLCPLV